MGQFLSMSGVAGASKLEVERVLEEFAAQKSWVFAPATTSSGNLWEFLLLAEAADKKATILYPSEFFEWDEASAFLSNRLGKPVFSLHVHDGDLWMFMLFDRGEKVTQFNPLPAYWDDNISVQERGAWSGNAQAVCRHWPGIAVGDIDKYLVAWDLDELGKGPRKKAYPDDEFHVGEDWQICDFMKKLGLVYPIDGSGKPVGSRYEFGEKQPAAAPSEIPPKKPRWKFW